jgi:aminopeptidase N
MEVLYVLLILVTGSSALNYRLPNNTIPVNYDIRLQLDPHNTSFTGETKISILAKTASNVIVLHSSGHTISGLTVLDKDSQNIYLGAEVDLDGKDFLIIRLRNNMVVGQAYVVTIIHSAFYGKLDGIYRSWNIDINKQMR